MKKNLLVLILLLCCCVSYGQVSTADTEVAFERGRKMIHNKQFDQATALLDSIASLNITPDYKAKYLAVNGILQRDSMRNMARALEYFHMAEALYPQVAEMKQGPVVVDIVFASMGLANYCDSLKLYPMAIEHYEKALSLLNNVILEGVSVADKNANDINLMILSFKQCIAIDYGHNRQFEDAQSAFEELKFEYGQMKLSSDSDLVMQGWLFDTMMRYAYATMYEQDMRNCQLALGEVNELLDKVMTGLNKNDPSIREALNYQMPMILMFAGHINVKVKNYVTAINLCDNAMTWAYDDTWKPFIVNTRGEALLMQGKELEARKCWAEVRRMAPQFYDNDNPELLLGVRFGRK